jgi:hypothetical protein
LYSVSWSLKIGFSADPLGSYRKQLCTKEPVFFSQVHCRGSLRP